MMRGRDNLELINQHIRQVQEAQQEAGLRLGELHRELNALRLETHDRYRKLARLRLDNLQAGQLVSRLEETDQTIVQLVEKLKQARQEMQDRIKASIARQAELEAERRDLERQRDETGEAMERELERSRKRLAETEQYRLQEERVRQAAAVAGNADEKASRAEREKFEKVKPYEADSLFMYLWNRRYLTPDYRAGWLIRRLDEWVAGLIDFRRNRVNYHMLQELPRRLREHALQARERAQLETQALETMERQAAEADGIPELHARVQAVEEQIQQHDAAIEAEEDRHRQLLLEQSGFNEAKDPLSLEILNVQVTAMQRQELTDLLRQARATPRPEDDIIVTRLQEIQQRQVQLEREIESLNRFLQEQQRNLAELEEVRRRYRRSGYDAYNVSFPGDFALGALLGQMLQGLMNSDMVWREVGRQHRGRHHGDGWGRHGDSSGDVGDDTGGFGGGGFRTGDGF